MRGGWMDEVVRLGFDEGKGEREREGGKEGGRKSPGSETKKREEREDLIANDRANK